MKILILVLSYNDNGGTYSKFYEAQKTTWDSIKVDNVDTFYYFGNSIENKIIGNEIYTTDIENYKCTEKMVSAFNLVKDFDFDYIVRTNSSSYLDKELFYEFLSNKPKNNFYGGIIGNHNGIPFASGALFVMSRDIFNLVIENSDMIDRSLIDDVSIGHLLQKFNVYPNGAEFTRYDIPDHGNLTNPNSINFFHYRLKTNHYFRDNDIQTMKDIHQLKIKNTIIVDKILLKFNENKNRISDINEHLETLYQYSKECEHITEMGVRGACSTWAFLWSNPKKMISYDIMKTNEVYEVEDITKECGYNFNFVESDVLKIEIEPTDLLFIDTLHTYTQLSNELNLHSKKVNKYIILHDTVSFGYRDEVIYEHASDIIKEKDRSKEGLNPAIDDFLKTEPGQDWFVFKTYLNNNGLTILKRK